MKTLFLMRHAKADNAAPDCTDLDRVLNERGIKEAQAVGSFLKKPKPAIDLVVCSTAVRARATTELMLAAAEIVANVRYEQRIYEASPPHLLEVIAEIESDLSAVLLAGHNPGLEELIRILTGRVEPMATAAFAKIDFDVAEWSEVIKGKGKLDWIVRPNELAAG